MEIINRKSKKTFSGKFISCLMFRVLCALCNHYDAAEADKDVEMLGEENFDGTSGDSAD